MLLKSETLDILTVIRPAMKGPEKMINDSVLRVNGSDCGLRLIVDRCPPISSAVG